MEQRDSIYLIYDTATAYNGSHKAIAMVEKDGQTIIYTMSIDVKIAANETVEDEVVFSAFSPSIKSISNEGLVNVTFGCDVSFLEKLTINNTQISVVVSAERQLQSDFSPENVELDWKVVR